MKQVNYHLKAVIEGLDHGLLILDRAQKIVAWNRWLEEITGLAQVEVLGRELTKVMPDLPSSIEAAINETLTDGKPRILSQVAHGTIFPLRRPIYQSANCYPLHDEEGQVAGAAISLYDLSQSRRFEELIMAEVRRSEEKYRSLFENSPDAVMVNVEDRVALANRAALRMFGAQREEELLGKSFFEIFHPDYHDLIRKRIAFIRQENAPVPLLEEKIVRLDGEVRDVEVVAAPFRYGDKKAIHIIIRDITERKRIERALKESEEKFRTLAEATPTVIMIYQDDRFVYANPAAMSILGYSFEELQEMNFWDVVHPDFRELVKARGEDNVGRYELKIIRKDGEERWVDLSGAAMKLGGKWAGIISVVDITERKLAEENFRRSLEESPLGVRIVSAEGETVYANRRALEIFGYQDKEDFNRIPTAQRYSPESYEAFLWRREKRKKKEALSGEYTITIKRTDGEERHLEVFRKEVLWDGKLQYQVLYNDVTEKKRAEEALALSEERYRTFVKQSSEAICLFELEHNPIPVNLPLEEQVDLLYGRAIIRECNETFARSHGYEKPEDMIGFKIGQVFPRLAKENIAYVKSFIANGYNVSGVETKEISRDGTVSYFLNSLVGYVEGGFLKRVWGAKQDITRIKRAEEEIRLLNLELEKRVAERTAELMASNRELEAFAYSVSHDLRTPLRAIKGYADILQEGYYDCLGQEGKRICQHIMSGVDKMNELIDAILGLSRIVRVEMRRLAIDMKALAFSAYSEVVSKGEQEKVKFILNNLPSVVGDPVLLKQVWMNLIANAVKFSRGCKRPEIEIKGYEREGEIVYEVKDNGVGFDMRYAEKMFGVFQRLHSESEFPGTGVGLAICRRIIERHGGRIWAEGKPGEGATFYFALKKSAPEIEF